MDPYPDEKFFSRGNISGSRSKSINRNIRPNVWLDTDFDIQSETDFDIRLNNAYRKMPDIGRIRFFRHGFKEKKRNHFGGRVHNAKKNLNEEARFLVKMYIAVLLVT